MRRRIRPTVALLGVLALLVCYPVWMSLQGRLYESDINHTLDRDAHSTHSEHVQRNQHGGLPFAPGNGSVKSYPKMIQQYTSLYPLTVPVNAEYKCVRTRTDPPTPVCLYDAIDDVFISHDLEATGLWEAHVLYDFMDVLRRDPDLGVIDIGANIGVYSLIAAQMGHHVVAVEPFLESIRRLHLAAQMGNTADKIIVLHNAVADIRTTAEILENYENKGDTKIILGFHGCTGPCPPTVRTIYMDDILEVANFSTAVIKIDCQGYEHRAFKYVSKLLGKIHVEYIYMEWITMRSFYSSLNDVDVNLVKAMVQLLLNREYRPYSLDAHGAHALDPRDWHSWPTDIVWRHLPTDEEKAVLLRNHFLNWPVN